MTARERATLLRFGKVLGTAIAQLISINPTAARVTQQAPNLALHLEETGQKVSLLLRDQNRKFTASFDRVIEGEGAAVKPVGPLGPNLNAHAERLVQTANRECLDLLLFFGEPHLRRVLKEWLEHYNTERPHQASATCRSAGSRHPSRNVVRSAQPQNMACFPTVIEIVQDDVTRAAHVQSR